MTVPNSRVFRREVFATRQKTKYMPVEKTAALAASDVVATLYPVCRRNLVTLMPCSAPGSRPGCGCFRQLHFEQPLEGQSEQSLEGQS